MNDFKSKLPDFQELSRFASKLFKDVKQSVEEIITEYKQKREPTVGEPTASPINPTPPVPPTASAPIPPTPTPPSGITPDAAKAAPIPPTPTVRPSTPVEKPPHTPIVIEVPPTHDAKNDPQ